MEPSLKDGERLVETDDQGRARPNPRRRGRTAGHAPAGAPRRGRQDRADAGAGGRLRPAAGAAGRRRRPGLRQAGQRRPARGPSCRPSSTASRTRPPTCSRGSSGIEGAGAVQDELPLAPTKDFAAAILGTVGPATAELVKDSKGRIKPGDDVGLSGLQKRYDEQLTGTRGATVSAVDEEDERRTLFTADPVAGSPLRTTLDVDAQTAAQQALADVGPASALVAIRPSTGDLVAVASGPGSKGYNTATFGQYAPGSTFKVVSALALLRAGLTPQSRVTCPPTTVVDGKTFKNYDDYPSSGLGEISFEDALANSCNTAFISQRDKLGPTVARAGGSRAGSRRRPRHRLPDLLRRGRRAGQRDPGGGQHDRPGHRARLADGDGHSGGLGA